MWKANKRGVELSGPKEACEELRKRAQTLLDEGRRCGRDISQHRTRLRDEAGNILFEGTLIEAAYLQFGSDSAPVPRLVGQNAAIETIGRLSKARAAVASFIKAERRLAALCSGPIGVRYRMNPDWSALCSLPKNASIPETRRARPNWLELYVPEMERALVMECARDAIKTKDVFQLLHRVVRLDGSIGWLRSHAVPVLRTNGDICQWLGAAIDVTADHETRKPI